MATVTFLRHTFSQKRNDALVSAASRNPSLCLRLTGHVLSPEALFLHCLGLSVCAFSAHVSNYLISFPVLSFLQRFQTVGGEPFTAC